MGRRKEAMEDLERGVLEERPELRKRWEEGRRRRKLATALVRMRAEASLTQSQLAELLGWDQPRVSRMESVTGPEPGPDSIAAYAKACGVDAAYVFAAPGEDGMRVWDAIGLGDEPSSELIGHLVRDEPEAGA